MKGLRVAPGLELPLEAVTQTFGIPRSAILCVVDVVDCVRTEDIEVSGLERHLGDFRAGRWAWLLGPPRVLTKPLAAKGALGLWDYDDRLIERALV